MAVRLPRGFSQPKIGREEKLPNNLQNKWIQWWPKLQELKNVRPKRCYKSENFGSISSIKFYQFPG